MQFSLPSRQFSRRTALRGMFAGAVVLGAAACSRGGSATAAASGSPVKGGTLVSGLYLEPTAFDPQREVFWETYRVSRNFFENLVQEDLSAPDGLKAPGLVPGLATKWTHSEDFTTWTFTLREGVSFHDGTAFDAKALDVNVERFADETSPIYDAKSAGILKARFSDLKATKVESDYSYSFTFNKPYIGFPRLLAQSISSPLVFSPDALQKYGQDGFAEHPIGTGPYTFVERKQGDQITLQRNEKYWGTQPYLDKLVFRIIIDDQSRLASLESGQTQLISRVQPTDVQSLLDKGFIVPEGHGAQLDYLVWNFKNPWAQNPAVRQAVAQAVDRAGDAKNIYNGYAQPLETFLPPGNAAYNENAEYGYSYDPDAAKKTLADAGIGDGEVSFNVVTDLAGQPEAAFLADNLKKVGIDATVVAFDRTTYSTRSANPEPEDGINLSEYGGTYPEWVSEAYASSVVGRGGRDYVDYTTIEAAIEAARFGSSEQDYVKLWQAADKALVESGAVIPTVSFTRYYAHSPQLGGFVWPNTNWYDLSKVWLG